MATVRIRLGSKVATARRIRSAIRRSGIERSELDSRLAVAWDHRERPLSRDQSRHGLAARGLRGTDGEIAPRAPRCAGAVVARPSRGDAAGAAAVRVPDRTGRMAATD